MALIELFLLGFTGIVFILLAHRLKLFTPGGITMALLMGIAVWFSLGALWLIPLLSFVFGTSLLSRFFGSKSSNLAAKSGKPRDAIQVWSNGGIYSLIALLHLLLPEEHFCTLIALQCISLSVCFSDTWASEIGMGFNHQPKDIITGKSLPQGISGGITLPGTLGGMLGAAGMSLISVLILPSPCKSSNMAWIIFLGGFLGMIIDSILGSVFQAKYTNQAKRIHEESDGFSTLISGFSWMNNDLVNFLSNLLIVLIALLLLNIL